MEPLDLRYWIWLAEACGAGSRCADLLLDAFSNDAKAIFDADADRLSTFEELSDKVYQALCKKDLSEAEKIENYCKRNRISLLCPAHKAYPNKLRAIRCRPVLLYYKGELPNFDEEVCIAMVGTRRMSEYGKRTAHRLSYDLARGGAVVVSGMAAGVDGTAHRGALDAQGHTVAVLGCGIDRAYPASHKSLMETLFQKGTVITEYKPFTEPAGQNFPIRNRIISGLCQGTIVIEADVKSGAMITAKTALYQGRDLFAIPGKIGEENSSGTHHLLKSGAKMVTEAIDILEEYEFLYPHKIHIHEILCHKGEYAKISLPSEEAVPSVPKAKKVSKRSSSDPKSASRTAKNEEVSSPKAIPPMQPPPPPTPPATALSEKEAAVYQLLDKSVSVDSDFLCRKSGLPIPAVMSALTLLEIKRLIEALPGGLYRRL